MTPEGYRVLITKAIQSDEDKFDVELYCKMSLVALDLQVKEEPVYGNIILFDVQHFTLSQFLAFTPTVTKNFMKCCVVSTLVCLLRYTVYCTHLRYINYIFFTHSKKKNEEDVIKFQLNFNILLST